MIKPFVSALQLVCLKSCSKLSQSFEHKTICSMCIKLAIVTTCVCSHLATAVTQDILNVKEAQTLV